MSFGMLQAQNRQVGDYAPTLMGTSQLRSAPDQPFVVPAQRTCGQMDQMRANFAEDPALEQSYQAHLADVAERISTGDYGNTEGVITIPVVVHVIWRVAAQNLATNRITDQVQVLTDDFRRQNADAANTIAMFQSVAGDAGVEFCLANRDPQNNPTDGITRTQTTTVNIGLTNDYYTEAPAWDRNKYLNIWVCELGNQLLGFAQFPGTSPANRDGVVINWRYFGTTGSTSPYNKGRTATHEVGHWLGLRHIWGDGNCSQDDGVGDTPLAAAANYNCNLGKVSCQTTDMVQNFMDYTEDACMNIFTQGQGAVVNATLAGTRGSLVFSTGCQTTTGGGGGCDTTEIGYPLAGTAQILLSGGTGAWGFVSGHNNYLDESKADYFANAGGATQIFGTRMEFGVATAANAASKVTVHVWDDNAGTPGTQLNSVDLLIDDIIAATGDITVMFPTAVNVTGPYYVGIRITYAAGDTVALLHNTDGDVTTATAWEEWSGGGWYRYDDTNSWGINVGHAIYPITLGANFALAVSPANPTITTPGGSVALSASGAATYSWTPATGLSCTNCSNPTANPTVTTTYTVTGYDSTNTCSTSELVTVQVNIVGIEDGLFENGISTYPNPSDGNFILEFNQNEIADLRIEMFNNIGQKLYQENLDNFSGNYRKTMDMTSMPAGIYHLRITDGEKQHFTKLIFE
jgi:hypothetical protein